MMLWLWILTLKIIENIFWVYQKCLTQLQKNPQFKIAIQTEVACHKSYSVFSKFHHFQNTLWFLVALLTYWSCTLHPGFLVGFHWPAKDKMAHMKSSMWAIYSWWSIPLTHFGNILIRTGMWWTGYKKAVSPRIDHAWCFDHRARYLDSQTHDNNV